MPLFNEHQTLTTTQWPDRAGAGSDVPGTPLSRAQQAATPTAANTEIPAEAGDWRKDIALIAQPVIDSLKELTEKPRKLKELNDQIILRQKETDIAEAALANLSPLVQQKPRQPLATSLDQLVKLWEGRLSDAQSDMEIAGYQIADLQGDKTLSEAIFEALNRFATGRGLTLLIALAVASAVFFGVRFMLRGYEVYLPPSSTRRTSSI